MKKTKNAILGIISAYLIFTVIVTILYGIVYPWNYDTSNYSDFLLYIVVNFFVCTAISFITLLSYLGLLMVFCLFLILFFIFRELRHFKPVYKIAVTITIWSLYGHWAGANMHLFYETLIFETTY